MPAGQASLPPLLDEWAAFPSVQLVELLKLEAGYRLTVASGAFRMDIGAVELKKDPHVREGDWVSILVRPGGCVSIKLSDRRGGSSSG